MNKLSSLEAHLLAGFCSGCCRLGDFNFQGIAKQRFKHPQKLCSTPRCALRKENESWENIFEVRKSSLPKLFTFTFSFILEKLSEKHFLAEASVAKLYSPSSGRRWFSRRSLLWKSCYRKACREFRAKPGKKSFANVSQTMYSLTFALSKSGVSSVVVLIGGFVGITAFTDPLDAEPTPCADAADAWKIAQNKCFDEKIFFSHHAQPNTIKFVKWSNKLMFSMRK